MSPTAQSIKLDAKTQERLKELGRLRDRSPHYLMKVAIESFLDREEAYEREKKEDQERWEQYQLTGESISHERASTWLRSLANGEVGKRPK